MTNEGTSARVDQMSQQYVTGIWMEDEQPGCGALRAARLKDEAL